MTKETSKNSAPRITVPYRWDRKTTVCTILAILILVGIWSLSVVGNERSPVGLKWITGIVCLGTILVTAAYLPLSLSVADRSIILRRGLGRIRIPLERVVSVRTIDPRMLEGSFRVFGSGGMFGFLGRHRNRRLGRYGLWITEWRNLLLVETADRRWVFNCRRADEFIRIALEERES